MIEWLQKRDSGESLNADRMGTKGTYGENLNDDKNVQKRASGERVNEGKMCTEENQQGETE